MSVAQNGLDRLVTSASAIVGAGAGAAISVLLGDPIAGAMAGQAFAEAGSEFASRTLGPRQEARVGSVLVLAAGAIIAQQTLGEELRSDGFFDGERSNAEELAEGVLLSAKDEHEERKLPYLANMLAAIAFMDTVNLDTANRMIREADRMTWLDMRILSIVARRTDFPLPEANLPHTGTTWEDWTVFQAATALRSDEAHQFLALDYVADDASELALPGLDLRMCALRVTSLGNLMVSTMRLETISKNELQPVYEALLRVPAEAAPTDAEQPPTDDQLAR